MKRNGKPVLTKGLGRTKSDARKEFRSTLWRRTVFKEFDEYCRLRSDIAKHSLIALHYEAGCLGSTPNSDMLSRKSPCCGSKCSAQRGSKHM